MVEVYTAAPHAQSRSASYQIAHGAMMDAVLVDQAGVDGWVGIGEFEFESGGAQWIRVDDNTGEIYSESERRKLVFDAVRLTRVSEPGDAMMSPIRGMTTPVHHRAPQSLPSSRDARRPAAGRLAPFGH